MGAGVICRSRSSSRRTRRSTGISSSSSTALCRCMHSALTVAIALLLANASWLASTDVGIVAVTGLWLWFLPADPLIFGLSAASSTKKLQGANACGAAFATSLLHAHKRPLSAAPACGPSTFPWFPLEHRTSRLHN